MSQEPTIHADPTLDELLSWAARGGAPPTGAPLPVPWPLLRRAAAGFDPFRALRLQLRESPLPRELRRDAALLHVHRAEQARLLCEVLTVVLKGAGEDDPRWLGVDFLALDAPRWEAWRGRARRELALSLAAELPAPRALIAATLWHPSLLGCDAAVALARAAVALSPVPSSLLALGRARVAAGLADASIAAIDRARSKLLDPDEVSLEALERCRVCALERRGDLRAVLASLRHLSGDRRVAGVGLALALLAGGDADARAFARDLAGAPAPAVVVESIRRRLPRWRSLAARAPRLVVADELAGGDPRRATTTVARAVLEGSRA